MNQSGIEEIREVHGGGRAVGRGTGSEVDTRQENGAWVLFLHDNEFSGRRVPADTFQPDVSNGGAELDRLRVGTIQRGAGDVSEFDKLTIAFFRHDELAAADIRQTFGVVEGCALRA